MTSVPSYGIPGSNFERTFIAIKPDGVQRSDVGAILARFEEKGYKLVALKMLSPTKEKAAGHYADLKKKPFFKGLVDYFSSGPIVAMVWEGFNAVAGGRTLLGATNPKDSLPGTIRGDLCVDIGRNVCHGSDSADSAKHEISFWFKPSEVSAVTSCSHEWVYEKGATPTAASESSAKDIVEVTTPSPLPASGLPGTNFERTFIAIKPDGVQRGKVGAIMSRFEKKGYKLVALKMLSPTKEKAAGHYADLKKKPFFQGLVDYFSSGPIVAMVWEGLHSVAGGRVLLGATNPKDSLPGTIRGDFCIDIGRNVCHGSDSTDSAKHEVEYWFQPSEISCVTSCAHEWVYEKGAVVAHQYCANDECYNYTPCPVHKK